MPFTDEQIKLLETNQYELFGFSKEHVKALLARLKAAERLARWAHGICPIDWEKDWFEASGKEPK